MSADLVAVEDLTPVEALIERARTEPWADDALCARIDPDLWYPEQGGNSKRPVKLCRTCPVMAECLADALVRREQDGVWGGMTETDRKRAWRTPASRDAALTEALAHVEALSTQEDPQIGERAA